MSDKTKLVRVQLDVPANRIKDLERIMEQTGLATRKDLYENALALFEWAVRERGYGRQIASIDGQDRIREITLPALMAVKAF